MRGFPFSYNGEDCWVICTKDLIGDESRHGQWPEGVVHVDFDPVGVIQTLYKPDSSSTKITKPKGTNHKKSLSV